LKITKGSFLNILGRLTLSIAQNKLSSNKALKNHLSKESLKSFPIISTENKTDARIYGAICASHKIANSDKT